MKNDTTIYFDKQDESSKLIYAIGLLWSKISGSLDSIFSKYDLNIAKFNILMVIKHMGNKDGIAQNVISQKLLVSASNITKLLDKLEKKEMIIRTSSNNDRRVKLIKITDSASNLLDEVWPLYCAEVMKITEKIDKKDLAASQKILLQWLDKLNK